jgi:hypothetical protein
MAAKISDRRKIFFFRCFIGLPGISNAKFVLAISFSTFSQAQSRISSHPGHYYFWRHPMTRSARRAANRENAQKSNVAVA